MSSELFLISELGLLVQEAKRKHPDVRDAAEKALALLKSDAGRSGQMWSPGEQAGDGGELPMRLE